MKSRNHRVECSAPRPARTTGARTLKRVAIAVACIAGTLGSDLVLAQIKSCDSNPKPSFCNAVRGDSGSTKVESG